jgi:hypothetical protein
MLVSRCVFTCASQACVAGRRGGSTGLLARTLLAAARGIDHVLHWSLFRRLHQTRAMIATTAAEAIPYQSNCGCSTGTSPADDTRFGSSNRVETARHA